MPNSTEKTMLILRALSDAKGKPVTLERLSSLTGINKSTASHILKTLCLGGYARRVSHTLGYLTGPELHMLTRYGRYGEEIISESHSLLEYLRKKYGGTAIIAVIRDGKKYIIDRASSLPLYRDDEANIVCDDLYRTVTGRALLASLPLDEALSVYDTLGAPTRDEWSEATSRQGFIDALPEISSKDCYCIVKAENGVGWVSFASIVRKKGSVAGALGLALKFENETEMPKASDIFEMEMTVRKCKAELERRLNYE